MPGSGGCLYAAADPRTRERRAEGLATELADAGVALALVETAGAVGGGAYPGVELPGYAVALNPASAADGPGNADQLAAALRAGEPPVVGRIRDGRLLLDVRTIRDGELADVVSGVTRAMRAVEGR